jgi:hypothetical protein
MILQQFGKSKFYRILIIFFKMLYFILITYAIIFTFTPYYSSYIEISYYVDYIQTTINYYSTNLIEGYDILMHGKTLNFCKF